jgi:methyltransferase-like protein
MLSTDHPLSKEAMLYLTERWPQAISFEALLSVAQARRSARIPAASDDTKTDAQVLSANILQAYSYSGTLMELRTWSPRMASEIAERPLASQVARLQAQSSDTVTNLRHDRVNLSELDRYLLQYLDGQHTQKDVVEALASGPLASGNLTIAASAQPKKECDPERSKEILAESIDMSLKWLLKAALLVA